MTEQERQVLGWVRDWVRDQQARDPGPSYLIAGGNLDDCGRQLGIPSAGTLFMALLDAGYIQADWQESYRGRYQRKPDDGFGLATTRGLTRRGQRALQ
jgi:hypothetical protein